MSSSGAVWGWRLMGSIPAGLNRCCWPKGMGSAQHYMLLWKGQHMVRTQLGLARKRTNEVAATVRPVLGSTNNASGRSACVVNAAGQRWLELMQE